jgi:hypothetical protein
MELGEGGWNLVKQRNEYKVANHILRRLNMNEVLQVALGIVGGGGAVVGLSTWLGNLWANRSIEDYRHRYTTELEALKTKYQFDIQALRGQIERGHIVHQRQFEVEYILYLKIWRAVVQANHVVL